MHNYIKTEEEFFKTMSIIDILLRTWLNKNTDQGGKNTIIASSTYIKIIIE